jgi:hypothetical protein
MATRLQMDLGQWSPIICADSEASPLAANHGNLIDFLAASRPGVVALDIMTKLAHNARPTDGCAGPQELG